jgi:hypothetical protein
MKFLCDCGHVILDQTDYIPYKARIAKDQDSDYVWGALADDLAAYMTAVTSGDQAARAAWIREHLPNHAAMLGTPEEQRLTVDYVAWGYVTQLKQRYFIAAYECERCGRLWVARGAGGASPLVGFSPDSGRYEHILATEHVGGDGPRPDPGAAG